MNLLKEPYRALRNVVATLFLFATTSQFASAHEAYVLDKDTISRDVATLSPNPFSIISGERYEFSLWAFISVLLVVLVLFFSLTKKIEKVFDPFLFKIKKYAPLVARLTFGTCLIASAYYGALFGPELPFVDLIGTYAPLLRDLFYILGTSLILGVFVRTASTIMLGVFVIAVAHYGIYMLTYANYLGEIIINLLLGSGAYSLTSKFSLDSRKMRMLTLPYEKYAFFFLRVLFGVAVIFASLYAKFFHSQLALGVVTEYNLTNYFHFTPLFIVLGACIIEIIIGIFFIIGFEIRFTAIVFLTFLGLSLSYFGEAVWPHIVLIGVNIALFMHGYDSFTAENRLFKQVPNMESVL